MTKKQRRRGRGRPGGTGERDDLPSERWSRASAVAPRWDDPRPRWRSALVFAASWAGFAALVLAVVVGVEYIRTHEKPVERVTVIGAEKLWGSNGCNRPPSRRIQISSWVVTYRSANPPGDFPAVYQDISCHEPQVGMTYSAVRRLNGTEFTTYLNPPRERRNLFEAPALALAVLIPTLFAGRLVWLAAWPPLKRWWFRTPPRLRRR